MILSEGLRWWRNRFIAAGIRDRANADQIDEECGGQETMIAAWLRWRATWMDLFAIMLGDRRG